MTTQKRSKRAYI